MTLEMQSNLDEYSAFVEEASNDTLGRVFDRTVASHPDKEAFVFRDIRVTYKQAQDQVNKMAKGLLRLDVRKGDKVAVFMPNNLEWLYCYLSIAKIGATLVAVNTRFKSSELEHSLIRSDVSTLILKDTFLGKFDALKMVEGLCPGLNECEPGDLSSKRLPSLKNIICLGESLPKGVYSFDKLMGLGDDSAMDDDLATAMASVTPDTALLHLLTSGTTGLPKAAEGTHRGWLRTWHWTFSVSPRGLGLTEKDRILGVVPFSGGIGSGQMPTSVLVGATLVIMESFDAEGALEIIEQERITGATVLVPTMVRMMLDHPDFSKYDLSCLKRACVSGAPVTADLFEAMRDKMGMEVVLTNYGSVETYGPIIVVGPDDSTEQLIQTVGRPLPHVLLKIVDPNTGEELPSGHDGEICMKGAQPHLTISNGYYNDPEKTAELIDKDGWLHMGDMGHIREKDGYLKVTGRLKDMIIVGGYNVYPAEVEQVLAKHPDVKDSSVVGVPDKRLGEVPIAFVQLKEGGKCSENEILEFCRDKISNMKVPRHVKFVSEFPLTLQGKVQKFKLREEAIKEIGL